MSINNKIDEYHDILPETFATPPLPPDWESDWKGVTIGNPKDPGLHEVEEKFVSAGQVAEISFSVQPTAIPDFPESFPGALVVDSTSPRPPADAYAFYLPFHLYRKRGWGIYLIAGKVEQLADDLYREAQPSLTWTEVRAATRLYLYEHEFFHHKAEMFSTRLEVAHRKNIYLEGQRPLYAETKGTDDHLEEALSDAYALKRVTHRLGSKDGWDWEKPKVMAFKDVLAAFIRDSGPGYRRGADIFENDQFETVRNEFAEEIFAYSPIRVFNEPPEIWSMFGQGFRGLANIRSDVKYLVHEKSPVSERLDLDFSRHARGTGTSAVS